MANLIISNNFSAADRKLQQKKSVLALALSNHYSFITSVVIYGQMYGNV